ncbi:MAG: YjfB family protein [Actinobacteria bacterium]|nr:YjfB family protein [Actinomycetota bacterium]
MEISTSTAALANLGTGRLQTEVKTAVLGKALDTEVAAATSLIEALSVSEPAGLTFSPGGLSAGRESRYIADL